MVEAESVVNRRFVARLFRRAEPRADRWRGRYRIPENAHPLVRRLFVELNARRMTLAELSLAAGVKVQTIRHWAHRHNPHIVDLIACLNVLGLDLAVQTREAA